MKRNGKIARLPLEIQDELNLRLDADESASTLLPWLNSLPDVMLCLSQHFGDTTVTPQNLSEWRKGGFLEWRMEQDLVSDVRRVTQLADQVEFVGDELPVDSAATVLAARYAALVAEWDGEPNPKLEARLRILRAMSRDVVHLQRSIYRGHLCKIKIYDHREERLERESKKTKAKAIAMLLEDSRGARDANEYGGGDYGAEISKTIYKITHDLRPEKTPVPGQPEPAQPVEKPTEIQPNPGKSNRIKPNSTRRRRDAEKKTRPQSNPIQVNPTEKEPLQAPTVPPTSENAQEQPVQAIPVESFGPYIPENKTPAPEAGPETEPVFALAEDGKGGMDESRRE